MSIIADVKDVFEHAYAQGNTEMTDILELAEDTGEEGLLVLAYWIGLHEDKCRWESIENIWCDAPEFHNNVVGGTRRSARLRLRSLRQH